MDWMFNNRGWIVFWIITLIVFIIWFVAPVEISMIVCFIYGHELGKQNVI